MTKAVPNLLILKCTTKLQKEIHLKSDDLISITKADENLWSWYANLVVVDDVKCVLFVNERTLFSFIVPNLKPEHFKNLDQIFKNRLILALSNERISGNQINLICPEFVSVNIAKTKNNSVTGTASSLSNRYKRLIKEKEIHQSDAVSKTTHIINTSGMASLQYRSPLEVLERELQYIGYEIQ